MPSNKMGVYYQTKIRLDFSILVHGENTILIPTISSFVQMWKKRLKNLRFNAVK